MTINLKLPELAWWGARELDLSIPDNWQLEVCNMAGFDKPALSPEQIREAVKSPIGSPPLSELAKGKNEVVVIFDDMSRITRAAPIIPFILEELFAAGIPENKIRFIAALGCHGAMGRSDFVKKLGEEVVSRFPVYNHNALNNFCTNLGSTSMGVPISVNKEVMNCDLKIGIGSIQPHPMVGFGGGSKIILPGITSLETNEAFHRVVTSIARGNPDKPIKMGSVPDNPLRGQIEEAGQMIGLDFKIDCLFNMWGDTSYVFAGLPRTTFFAGAEVAKKHYCSSRAKEKDIVIANIYIKVNEPHTALTTSMPSISRNGGDLVLVCNSPEGVVTHYLMGAFGRESGGPLCNIFKIPENINRILILSEYPDVNFASSFEPLEKVLLVQTWDNALAILQQRNGTGRPIQVAVYPNSEIQYCTS